MGTILDQAAEKVADIPIQPRTPPARSRLVAYVGWIGAWAAIIALAGWLSYLAPLWLAAAVLGSIAWTGALLRRRSWLAMSAAFLLWTAVASGLVVQLRIHRIATDWSAVQLGVEERSAEALGEALDELLASGERAAEGAAEVAPLLSSGSGASGLYGRLHAVQRSTGVSAIALYTPDGVARAWAGSHRGEVPAAARLGTERYLFHEGPLFTYLYFVRSLPQGYTAIAAFLLDAEVEIGAEGMPFASRFERRYGLRPRFWHPERARAEAIWDWATDRPILSVSFEELTQEQWRERAIEQGRIAAALSTLAAFLLLALIRLSRPGARPGIPIWIGAGALLLAPLDLLLGAESLFSPRYFFLPHSRLSLGALLVFLFASTLWGLTRPARRRAPLPAWTALPILIVAYPLVLRLVVRGASPLLLESRFAGGFPLQLATALLLALGIRSAMRHARSPGAPWPRARLLRAAGLALPPLLAAAVLLAWDAPEPVSLLLAGLWAVPALLAMQSWPTAGNEISLKKWLVIGWMAGSAALTFLWPLHIRADLVRAEAELATLGSDPDPALEELLSHLARRAQELARDGETGANLLYQSWVESGLAEAGHEARIGWWTEGVSLPASELNLSELPSLGSANAPNPLQGRTRWPDSVLIRHQAGVEGINYRLTAPLGPDHHLSVEIPVRRRFMGTTPLIRYLDPVRRIERTRPGYTLTLLPTERQSSTPVRPQGGAPGEIEWTRLDQGWRASTLLQLPEGSTEATLLISGSSGGVMLVRAILAQVGIMAVFLLIWLLARAFCHDFPLGSPARLRWLRSFRARLSLALFVFFLLPTLVFGAVAYGAVAREVARSAMALAQRALDQASSRLGAAPLTEVGAELESDLLLYSGGTLAAASAPELIDLGLFQSWIPPEIQLSFERGAGRETVADRERPEAGYLVAYRQYDPATVLAAPIPLESSEITRRQQEFRDIIILVILAGLALSTILALLVGRALVRPLDELRRAAATVGKGDLRTPLDAARADEFGSLYESFNRMVEHLRRTRSALLQETRRTETIVGEAATGVLALDDRGHVELINPRATELLGSGLRTGDPVLTGPGAGDPFCSAIRELWSSPSEEVGTELEHQGRLIRLRLRRLPGEAEGGGGAVVALEDMTAEVRTARVLAWGEMARQVAHEIKNPLTPIQLAVQHMRRAFRDGRTDYGEILERNVEVVLAEIERLGGIARAFSRFGSPATGAVPLEPVDVRRTLEEVVTLYGSTADESGIEASFPAQPLPPALARTTELKEVLLNLLENAREALGPEGQIKISAAYDFAIERLVIVVEDSGSGIPAEQLPHIFEPHFSTRSSGTGLGLAIVRRIVDSWGGEIEVESELAQGTRFWMLLPTAPTSPT